MIRVTENLRIVSDLLAEEARDAGRDPTAVRLLAVSKKMPPERVLEAAAAGQRDFGENFVQEGLEKIAAVNRDGLCWHFIGHLQSNKSRAVAEHFDWVHTIDRARIATRLSRQRPDSLAPLNVCLQVNIDDEAGKSGVTAAGLRQLAEAVAGLPRIRLRGLMCLPTERDGFNAQRQPFKALRRLAEQLGSDGIELDTLSMGMSNDHRAAIFEGSTMVRIGTALFGARGKA